jgi:cobalt-zinc-cadmium efflux system outer membrane protein
MRSWVLCAALAVAALPRVLSAQTLTLTEAEALQRLSPESPRARAMRAEIEIARADVLAARRWPNPRAGFNRESVAGTTEYMTTVGQTLPITGVRGLQTRAAESMVDAFSARADDTLRRARADLRSAFAQLVAAQVRHEVLASARDRTQGIVDVLARREAAGDIAAYDRLRAQREVLDIDADLAITAADRAQAQATLASFFGEAVDASRLVAVFEGPTAAPLPSVEDLVTRAESTRGEITALQKEIEAARWSTQAADRRRIPEPDVTVGTKSSSVLGGSLGSVVMVQAAVPIFDRGRPENALARARSSQADARLAAFRFELRAQLAGWRAAVLERRGAADRYRAAGAAGAADLERIAQVSYEAGERGILELLDAYRTTSSARARQTVLDLSARQAEIELEFLSGWEIK